MHIFSPEEIRCLWFLFWILNIVVGAFTYRLNDMNSYGTKLLKLAIFQFGVSEKRYKEAAYENTCFLCFFLLIFLQIFIFHFLQKFHLKKFKFFSHYIFQIGGGFHSSKNLQNIKIFRELIVLVMNIFCDDFSVGVENKLACLGTMQ